MRPLLLRPGFSLLLLALFAAPAAQSQTTALDGSAALSPAPVALSGAYALPFASEGNQFELIVANPETEAASSLVVTVAAAPMWLAVEPAVVEIEGLDAGAETVTAFRLAVSESAPVGQAAPVRLVITSSGVEVGQKEFLLEVEAPREIELRGNYPNPFNPETVIGYVLPSSSRVRLVVYDVLGREVARLVDGEQPAGYREAVWSGARYASGLYIYRLEVEPEAGGRVVRQATMLLVK